LELTRIENDAAPGAATGRGASAAVEWAACFEEIPTAMVRIIHA
jgi:hypothetical protein